MSINKKKQVKELNEIEKAMSDTAEVNAHCIDKWNEIQKENWNQRAALALCNTYGLFDKNKNIIKTAEAFRREQIEKCRKDIIYFCNYYCWTHDPRERKGTIPFRLYKYQEDLLIELQDSIKKKEDILIRKSRDMGVSWCLVVIFVHQWLFESGTDFKIGSYKEEFVDKKGDINSLMEKARFTIRSLPKWMQPKGYDEKNHAINMLIKNNVNNSKITGQTATEDFGRGGRETAVAFDEFAFWEHDRAAWKTTADTTPCRIVVSTTNGRFNKFYDLHSQKDGYIKIIDLHWKLHPDKDEEWYEKEKRRRTPDEIASELDMKFVGSVSGAVFPEFKKDKHVYYPSTFKSKNIEILSKLSLNHPIYRVWDYGGHPAVLWCYYEDGKLYFIKEYVPTATREDLKPSLDYVAKRVISLTKEWFPDYQIYDLADKAGKQRKISREGSNTLVSEEFILNSRYGIYPNCVTDCRIEPSIALIRSMLVNNEIEINQDCTVLIDAFDGNYRRMKPPPGKDPEKEMPVAEEHPYEDVADCARYIAWFLRKSTLNSNRNGNRILKRR